MARLVTVNIRHPRIMRRALVRYYAVPSANRPPLAQFMRMARRTIINDNRPNAGWRQVPLLDYRGVAPSRNNAFMTMAWVGPHGMVGDSWHSGTYTPIWWPWPDEPPQQLAGYPFTIEAGLIRPSFQVVEPWRGSVSATTEWGRRTLREAMWTHIVDYAMWVITLP